MRRAPNISFTLMGDGVRMAATGDEEEGGVVMWVLLAFAFLGGLIAQEGREAQATSDRRGGLVATAGGNSAAASGGGDRRAARGTGGRGGRRRRRVTGGRGLDLGGGMGSDMAAVWGNNAAAGSGRTKGGSMDEEGVYPPPLRREQPREEGQLDAGSFPEQITPETRLVDPSTSSRSQRRP